MHRWIIGPGAAVVVAGATALLAPTAQAAQTATATCTSTQNFYLTLAPGETFTLTLGGLCAWLAPGAGNADPTTYGTTGTEARLPAAMWTSVTLPVVAVYTAPACGPARAVSDSLLAARDIYPSATDQNGYGLTITAAECPGPPPDVIQQVGAQGDAGCASVNDAALNIGGSASGGWGNSWAQWANDGRGGAVCTRTLTYSDDLGHYVVAS